MFRFRTVSRTLRHPIGRKKTRCRSRAPWEKDSLSRFLGLSDVQAIYKWQRGESLPSTDNLVALSRFLDTPIDQILVLRSQQVLRDQLRND